MSKTMFLSTVSSEFGPLRRRIANLTQRTKKCQIRHQNDFFHRGVKTLQRLVEEIQESDLVVHLIGAQPGWCIPADQSTTFLDDEKHSVRLVRSNWTRDSFLAQRDRENASRKGAKARRDVRE